METDVECLIKIFLSYLQLHSYKVTEILQITLLNTILTLTMQLKTHKQMFRTYIIQSV